MASLFKGTTTYDPIYCLLNVEDEDQRDELTQRWKDNKLQELNFVGIVGALLAGVLTSTGSWPQILPNGVGTPWTVRACWYSGLILALTAVITAAQQAIRLHRLSCHPRANLCLRRLLSNKHRDRQGNLVPRRLQVYAWQMAGVFLSFSILALLGGLFVMIWSSTGHLWNQALKHKGWWNSEAKLAVAFSIVAFFCLILFSLQQITLYSFDGDDDTGEAKHEAEKEGDGVDEKGVNRSGSSRLQKRNEANEGGVSRSGSKLQKRKPESSSGSS